MVLIKRLLSLNEGQKSIIFGSLLGDGTMWIGKGGINANFKIEHGLKQKELVFWKYEKLKNFVFTEPKISFRYQDDGIKYPKSWWFRTVRHPDLTKIYRLFYVGEGLWMCLSIMMRFNQILKLKWLILMVMLFKKY